VNPSSNARRRRNSSALCIAVPKLNVPAKKTKVSRSVIPSKIKMTDSIENLSNAVAIVTGFLNNDSKLIGTSIKDVIVEPARKHMIPGFDKVKQNAIRSGALGVTISGAGPSVIAFATKSSNLKKIQKAMEKGFSRSKIKCSTVICIPCNGAIDSK